MVDRVLIVGGLKVNFYTYAGVVKALDGIDIDLRPNETHGLVGETGCGKSVTVHSLIKLIPMPPGKIEGGRALLHAPVTCRTCRGKGCPECGGSGTLDTCEACGGATKCVKCRGFGRYKDGKSCRTCGASGLCASCGGSGSRYLDLLALSAKQMREIRGGSISMILQEPMSALNPVLTVAEQVGEAFYYHQRAALVHGTLAALDRALKDIETSRKSRWRRPILRWYRFLYRRMERDPESRLLQSLRRVPVVRRYHRWLAREMRAQSLDALNMVRIPSPEKVLDSYPHELSGGMMQRVVISIALASHPRVLIADEPTTALDVTIQSQILRLMADLKGQLGTAIIFITHDLAVIAQVCDRVSVMYAGTIAESAPTLPIFREPLHPYTRGLVRAIPGPHEDVQRLPEIAGSVPNLVTPPSGCRFHPRCPFAKAVCKEEKPLLLEARPSHRVACHMYGPYAEQWTDADRLLPQEVVTR